MRALAWCAALACAAPALLAAGCEAQSARYCGTDADCPAKTRDGTYGDSDDGDGPVPGSLKVYCHPSKHYCYAGCGTDADCQDPGRRMNAGQPAARHCNPLTRACGPEPFTNLPDGSVCQSPSQCASGRCEGQICCAEACGGPCQSCGLPGSKGQCKPLPAGQGCGSPPCQAGSLGSCDGLGSCVGQGCGGFACAVAGDACKSSCTDAGTDCMPGFVCQSNKCLGDLPLGQACYGSQQACHQGTYCTDGVCCEKEECDDCNACQTGSGKCGPLAQGQAPAGQCPGDSLCGAGLCDGKGSCAYRLPGTICTQSCALPAGQSVTACTASHGCGAPQLASCGFLVCDGAGLACLPGCASHADCVAGSACDRRGAHLSGTGVCVDPALVATVASGGSIQAALDSLGARTHLRLGAGTYGEALSITAKKVTLVGDGSVTIKPLVGAGITLGNGAEVALQGLTVSGATGSGGHGLLCFVSTSASLAVIESTLEGNGGMGLSSTNCDVEVHRSTIRNNAQGGVDLAKGSFVLTNNLIHDNGSSGSGLGGLQLSAGNGSVSFVNNTVVKNHAHASKAGGVICSGGELLRNSIVAGNDGSQFGLCSFDHSAVHPDLPSPAPPASGNLNDSCGLDAALRPATSSACVGAGDSAAAGKLDHGSGPRLLGAAVDLGAFEVQ